MERAELDLSIPGLPGAQKIGPRETSLLAPSLPMGEKSGNSNRSTGAASEAVPTNSGVVGKIGARSCQAAPCALALTIYFFFSWLVGEAHGGEEEVC